MEPDQRTNGGHSMGAAAASLMAGSHYPFLGFVHLTWSVEYRSKINEMLRSIKHIRSSCELEIGFFYRLISHFRRVVSVDRN